VRSRCRAARSRRNAAVASPSPRTKASRTQATPMVAVLVPTRHFLEPVKLTGRTGEDRFVVEMPLEIERQAVGSIVTTGAVLLQALHHDPVEVALELVQQLRRVSRPAHWPWS
jgi:hypothetical protein